MSQAAYSPKEVEEKWNNYWFSKNLFNLKIVPGSPVFSIALPPPNITGSLHMGHALNGTLQDILIRWKRMQGYTVHWQPGTDHAGISTQMVVERKLKKEGKNRHTLGREKFLEACWQWRNQYGDTIYSQYKRLGVSFSWDHLMFTMDPAYVKAIYHAFAILYKEGFIYRGKRVTNWCPRCQTSLSDLEVEHAETQEYLYFVKYLLSKENEFLVVATTRPESIFGDVAIAVNPNDKRYQNLIGSQATVPLMNRTIPIIADTYVDMDFGTGALKVTPAHDANDWEIGERHNLPQPTVINQHAHLCSNEYVPSQFHNLERFAARKAVLSELAAQELLVETQDYTHGLGFCERCHTVIEPYLSDQWYVSMKKLAQPAIDVVEQEQVKFIPRRYASTYLDWMRNIKDWCISRQLWWGHRIPLWKCLSCQAENVFETTPDECPQCKAKNLEQDPDVLDTWFSSALWPFATLGWPDNTQELQTLYPTSILSTAREIINLWVARMIFTSLKFLGKVPFKEVLIHPVIQTADGKRMSKSKGNAVDPLDMIEQYGADANRFWFASLGIKGDQDVRFRAERLLEYQHFVNKIWNAGKFVLLNIEKHQCTNISPENLTLADRWILSCYHRLLQRLSESLSNYDFDEASRALYEFIWDYFCDWYVEIAKKQIETTQNNETRNILAYIFEGTMRALHPIMPYITEELWSKLPNKNKDLESIMFADFPQTNKTYIDPEAEAQMEFLIKIIRSIRNIRHTYNIAARTEAEVSIECPDERELQLLTNNSHYLQWLSCISPLFTATNNMRSSFTASAKVSYSTIHMPLAKLIDIEKTKTRLFEKKNGLAKKLVEKRHFWQREDFQKKAPQDRIDTMQQEITELENQLSSLESQLKVLELV